MLLNDDMLYIICEVQLGFTIPTELLESDMYKCISGTLAKYSRRNTKIENFINHAMDDNTFVNHACSSLQTARWFKGVIDHYVFPLCIYNRSSRIDVLIRLALFLDDREIIQTYLLAFHRFYSSNVFYAFATVDQMEWLISTNAEYLYLNYYTRPNQRCLALVSLVH